MNLANMHEIAGHKGQAVSCQATNAGLYAAAIDRGMTSWISVGSDEDNDFSGVYHRTVFTYARKSGFGGKGSLPRGTRAYRLSLGSSGDFHGRSHVIDASTNKVATDMSKHSPPEFAFVRQTQCGLDHIGDMFDWLVEDPDEG